MIFYISVILIVISPCSFLILFGSSLSYSRWAWVKVNLFQPYKIIYLNLFSFFKFVFLFAVLIGWFSLLSSRSSMHSSIPPSLLLVYSSVFFISFMVLFISDWFFFMYSSSWLTSLCVHLFFSLNQLAFLLPMLWIFYLVNCLFLFN